MSVATVYLSPSGEDLGSPDDKINNPSSQYKTFKASFEGLQNSTAGKNAGTWELLVQPGSYTDNGVENPIVGKTINVTSTSNVQNSVTYEVTGDVGYHFGEKNSPVNLTMKNVYISGPLVVSGRYRW